MSKLSNGRPLNIGLKLKIYSKGQTATWILCSLESRPTQYFFKKYYLYPDSDNDIYVKMDISICI